MDIKRTALGIALTLSLFSFGAGAENTTPGRTQNATTNPAETTEKKPANTSVSAVPARAPIRRGFSPNTEIHLTDLKIYPSF